MTEFPDVALRPMLSDAQATQFLGLSPGTLRQWRGRKEGPPFFKVGNAVRYSVRELEEWLESRHVTRDTTVTPRDTTVTTRDTGGGL